LFPSFVLLISGHFFLALNRISTGLHDARFEPGIGSSIHRGPHWVKVESRMDRRRLLALVFQALDDRQG
jgi:hypothetical protein